MNWKYIDFNWYPFLSIDFFEVEKENQLTDIDSRFKWIESTLISIEILCYQYIFLKFTR